MKKILFIIILALITFSACSSDGDDKLEDIVTVLTNEPVFEGFFDIILTGEYNITKGNPQISETGFCWVEGKYHENYPTIKDDHIKATLNGKEFTATISRLKEETFYMVRAYVKIEDEYIYSTNYRDFMPALVSYYLPKLDEVSFYYAGYYKETNKAYINSLHCKITTYDRYPIYECGVCYGKTPDPTIENDMVKKGELNKEHYLFFNIDDLDPGVEYHFRFWATNEAGIAYSENFKFLTTNWE